MFFLARTGSAYLLIFHINEDDLATPRPGQLGEARCCSCIFLAFIRIAMTALYA